MEKRQKCSNEEHKDAIIYCQQCKIFMCNKCLNNHKELFKKNHELNNLEKNNDLFIELCKKPDHEKKMEFFCKGHNELCCVCCISKLDNKGYGQHKDCDICQIESIKEEKKNKNLQDLTNSLNNNIDELKLMFEKINKKKEELKLYVQKIFTKLRTALNEREDELLLAIDNKFNDNFCKENIIEESIKLPNKIKKNLEKEKISENDWNDANKLSSLINYCINIEMDIKSINDLNDNIKNSQKFNDNEIKFTPENESIDKFIQSIKSFGDIAITQLKKEEKPLEEEDE